ncbi:MAG: hypothetical protein GY870_21280 [archaeon]|nr:hypothetical protein [archaeon]
MSEISEISQIKYSMIMPKSKLLIQLSRNHPSLEFLIKTLIPLPDSEGNMLLQVSNPEGGQVDSILKNLSSILSRENIRTLHKSRNLLIIFVKMKDPVIMRIIISHSIMIQYPIKIKNGIGFFNLVGKREEIDKILTNFEEKNLNFSIEKLGIFNYRDFLTANQKKILHIAKENGYYEIPRKISLTDLAKKLEISASALSETLRRIHKKLANYYLIKEKL